MTEQENKEDTEMNYEQKYKEALKVMNSLYNIVKYQSSSDALLTFQTLEKAFPELRESEDEKIRKNLITFLDELFGLGKNTNFDKWSKSDCAEWIAWLEKQGETKHTCNNCKTFQDMHQNCPYSPIFRYKDLSEAKKHLDDETNCDFWLEKQGEQKSIDMSIKEKAHQIAWETSKRYDPLLSKESWCEMAALDMASWLENQGRQNPAWSEEDERILNKIQDNLREFYVDKKGYPYVAEPDSPEVMEKNWLQSFKDRVQPNHWKPSKEQLRVLQTAIRDYGICAEKNVLESLYNDIKNF